MCVCVFFHVVCKISNFDMWTAKHLAQASCTELTLPTLVTDSIEKRKGQAVMTISSFGKILDIFDSPNSELTDWGENNQQDPSADSWASIMALLLHQMDITVGVFSFVRVPNGQKVKIFFSQHHHMKSDNLQYNTLVRRFAGTNDSSTNRLMFQAFFYGFLQT